jgi:hypothetical protein
MLNSMSSDSFESVTLTNNSPRNTSELIINNDVVIYRSNNSIFIDYFCIIIVLGTLSILSYILIKQKYN